MSEHDTESMLDFVSAVSGETYLKVEENLGDGFVRLRTAEAERRQAKHDIRSFEDIVIELLRNARDAHAQRVFVATARDGDDRMLTMIDDGIGIPETLHQAIFEPRVTSKLETMVMDRWGVHGRGMALFSVYSNVGEGRVAASNLHRGTSIFVRADTGSLPERADQSSWPVVERDEGGALRVTRGPHNIVRRVLEFACEHPEIDVYLGSPVEVLTTVHCLGRDVLDTSELLFCDDTSRLAVWQRPAASSDASDLVEIAEAIALSVSERTAHRILGGDLAPLDTVLHQVLVDDEPTPCPEPDIYRDRRSLKIHSDDLTAFRRDLTSAFDALAEKYYLHLKGEPRVHVGRDQIRVRFDVDKEE
ncbi:MAG: ATP-binding protein [Coriobacteriia bacterium]|nr:ATP-binding protein [Coriobacteriia bacterium]